MPITVKTVITSSRFAACPSEKPRLSLTYETKCTITAPMTSSDSAWPTEMSQNARVRIASCHVKLISSGSNSSIGPPAPSPWRGGSPSTP